MSPLPLYRDSFARGAVVVGSSPVLLLLPLALILALWLGELAAGYVGTPVPPLVNAFAVPPISTASSDAYAVFTLFGQRTGLYLVLPALLVRAMITGLLAAGIVERFDTGRLSAASVLSAVRAFPIVLGMLIVGFIAIMFGQVVALLLGPGIGVLISYVVMPAFLVYALGFVPFIAVTEARSLGGAFRRAYAGARSPGGRHFMLSVLYLLLLNVLQFAIPIGSAPITAAPTLSQWVGILLMNVFHLAVFAMFGYRWLMAAPVVPEPQVPARRR